MKAKEAVKLIDAEETFDLQQNRFLLCALEEHKRMLSLRMNQGAQRVTSVLAVRKEFCQWVHAVRTRGGYDWINKDGGEVFFDEIIERSKIPNEAKVSIFMAIVLARSS